VPQEKAAQIHLRLAGSEAVIAEAAADKGYHAAATIEMCDFFDVRTYIQEPKVAATATCPEEQRRATVPRRW